MRVLDRRGGMKKYLTIILLIFFSLVSSFYFYFIYGAFIPSSSIDNTNILFRTDNGLYYSDKEEISNEIEIKGIYVGQSTAFQDALDFETDEETFLSWFYQISEMGANTVLTNTVYNQGFYDALYRFNNENEKPLYLVQGIRADEDSTLWDKDAYAPSFINRLKKDGRKAVDVIHGRKVSINDTRSGNGFFMKDLSPWVLGYIIGDEWNPDLIAFTNEKEENPVNFNGSFIYTDGANAFEVVMAEIMDDIVSYETKKYGCQRPVSFMSSSQYDPFTYKEEYAEFMGKYNVLDIEHLNSTDNYKAGIFASYQYNSPPENLLNQLEPNIMNSELLEKEEVKNYLTLLNTHHKKTLVIAHFNVPSVRTSIEGGQGISEKMQGEMIVKYLEDFNEAGISHAIIHSWQDTWYLRAWNTAHAVDNEMMSLWHDAQTETQHYGIMTFEPFRNNKVMRVDGDREDWEDIVPIDMNGFKVSLTSDPNYLYALIEKEGISSEDIVAGFDFLDQVGTKKPSGYSVEFNRDIDFLLKVHGEENTELLVQERYENTRPQFLERLHGVNPYIHIPVQNSSKMVPIEMVGWDSIEETDAQSNNKRNNFKSFNTGKLIHGNGNPDKSDFNSLTDFSFGINNVEIRIPYYLLNFYDPINRYIHDDYYQHFGVEPQKIKWFYFGIGYKNDLIQLTKIELPSLSRGGEINSRLKESYKIVQSYWRK